MSHNMTQEIHVSISTVQFQLELDSLWLEYMSHNRIQRIHVSISTSPVLVRIRFVGIETIPTGPILVGIESVGIEISVP